MVADEPAKDFPRTGRRERALGEMISNTIKSGAGDLPSAYCYLCGPTGLAPLASSAAGGSAESENCSWRTTRLPSLAALAALVPSMLPSLTRMAMMREMPLGITHG